MERYYSMSDDDDIMLIINCIIRAINKLKCIENDAMFQNTSFIHISNMSISTDYRSFEKKMNTVFHSKNNKKIFEYENSHYYINHMFYTSSGFDWVQYTIEITMDDI